MKNHKPIIGIDGNEANMANRVGVNTYAYELLRNIAMLEDEWNNDFEVVVYLKSQPLSHMPKSSRGFRYEILNGGGQWILKTLMPHLYSTQHKPAVFWTPSHYIPPFAPMPRVCSIMDLGYLEFTGQFKKYDFWQLKLWSAWSISRSQKILAISETTRKDITKRYPKATSKIITTLLGYDNQNYPPRKNSIEVKKVLKKYSIGQKYVLFMSTLKPSKNIEGLLNAWSYIEKKYPNTELVVAGKKGWLFENIFFLTQKLKLQKRVVFTDFVEEIDKPTLVANAACFVLPSFWEGFGLDVVSSMACGVPVVVSNRGSLPEVVGDAGIIINPDDTYDIAAGIERVLSASKQEYAKMSKAGEARATHFSWQKTARETIQALRSLM